NEGLNTFHLRPVSGVKMFLNEINITYTRHFRADGDQLLFNYAETGGVEFVVDNLSVSDSETLIVWDVSNPTEPVAIPIDTGDLGTGVGNTVRFGRTLDGDSTFLVSTLANVQTPIISKYTPIELNPTDGAEWIAVTHSELRPQIDRLATYRAQANRIETHVVDIEDIINQYGFGYPVPDAIHSYMQAGYQTWSTKPKYLLLAGDATINPRQRTCVDPTGKACLFPWNTSDLDYVPTYLVHQDPFVGLIPSDHPFSLLEGDDLIPEIAVGRITVGNRDFNNTFNSTSALDDQAKNIVDKIIRYEAALENEEPWTSRFAFLADDADAGGAFCYDNENAASRIPDEFLKTFFCLDDYIADNPTGAQNRINAEFTNEINNNSAAIVNYRGHGSVVNWGGGLLTRDDRVNMFNNGKPFVIISADCLDNYFAFNNLMSLSEAFMRAPNAGSVAHWGSTGLGFSWEHTILHNAFYDGLYEEFLPTIGDAIVHAKTVYEPSPGSRSELYAFTLQGDPAMNMPYVKHEVFIPIVIKPQIDIPSPFPRVSED
ncbi:MAG: C25 family cysteine peptidase, partial [Candidatus Promineifilaceae bacterium]